MASKKNGKTKVHQRKLSVAEALSQASMHARMAVATGKGEHWRDVDAIAEALRRAVEVDDEAALGELATKARAVLKKLPPAAWPKGVRKKPSNWYSGELVGPHTKPSDWSIAMHSEIVRCLKQQVPARTLAQLIVACFLRAPRGLAPVPTAAALRIELPANVSAKERSRFNWGQAVFRALAGKVERNFDRELTSFDAAGRPVPPPDIERVALGVFRDALEAFGLDADARKRMLQALSRQATRTRGGQK